MIEVNSPLEFAVTDSVKVPSPDPPVVVKVCVPGVYPVPGYKILGLGNTTTPFMSKAKSSLSNTNNEPPSSNILY